MSTVDPIDQKKTRRSDDRSVPPSSFGFDLLRPSVALLDAFLLAADSPFFRSSSDALVKSQPVSSSAFFTSDIGAPD